MHEIICKVEIHIMHIQSYYDDEPCEDSIRVLIVFDQADFGPKRIFDSPPPTIPEVITSYLRKFHRLYEKQKEVADGQPIKEYKEMLGVGIVYKKNLDKCPMLHGIMTVESIVPMIFDAYNVAPKNPGERTVLELSLCFNEKDSPVLHTLKRTIPNRYNDNVLARRKEKMMKMCEFLDELTFDEM